MLLHTDFYVRSINDSLRFYVDALGFKLMDDFEIKGDLVRFLSDGKYSECRVVLLKIGIGKAMLELIEFTGGADDMLYKGSLTILVPSVDEKIYDLWAKGISKVSEIFYTTCNKFGKSKVVFFTDLDGNKIEFLEKVL